LGAGSHSLDLLNPGVQIKLHFRKGSFSKMYIFTISMIFFSWQDSNKVMRESQIWHKKQLPVQDLTNMAYHPLGGALSSTVADIMKSHILVYNYELVGFDSAMHQSAARTRHFRLINMPHRIPMAISQ
jgi:hypothetical protein